MTIQGQYVDWSELLRGVVKRGYALSDLGAFNVQYVATDCETASQAYYARQQALYETADEMEQDAAEMDSAAWAVQQFICEPLSNVPNGAGKKICIDLFIMAPTILLLGEGDGRPFNVDSKYTDSRAQLYINPTTLEHELMLNGTRIYLVKPPTDGGLLPIPWRWDPPSAGWVEVPPYRHLSRDVEVSRDMYNGRIIIRYSLYNGLATTMGRDAVPAIDARVTLHPLSNGQYYVEFYGDDYPSTQVNQMIDGQWTELARRQEHPGFFGPRFLTDMYPKANDIRNSNPLPPGCDLQ